MCTLYITTALYPKTEIQKPLSHGKKLYYFHFQDYFSCVPLGWKFKTCLAFYDTLWDLKMWLMLCPPSSLLGKARPAGHAPSLTPVSSHKVLVEVHHSWWWWCSIGATCATTGVDRHRLAANSTGTHTQLSSERSSCRAPSWPIWHHHHRHLRHHHNHYHHYALSYKLLPISEVSCVTINTILMLQP